MNHYLYALLDGQVADPIASIGDLVPVTGRISACRAGRHWLISGEHDGSEILQTRRFLLAHARVLEALMTTGTLLPMRFGMVVERLAPVQNLVQLRQAEIEGHLGRLKDKVEIGLRVSFDREAALAVLGREDRSLIARKERLAVSGPASHGSRIEFGRHVADALDARRSVAQKIVLTRLAPMLEEYILRAPEEDVEVLRAECLVRRENLPQFEAILEAAVADCGMAPVEHGRTRLIGPTPPYNFVSINLVVEEA